MAQRVFISADHGLSVIYFLQSEILSTLLKAGVEVIVFTDDEARPMIEERFHQPGLTFEGLRLQDGAWFSTLRYCIADNRVYYLCSNHFPEHPHSACQPGEEFENGMRT